MDKNAIKKYAVWARRELISRVSQKALQYGITEKDIVPATATSVNGVVLSAEEMKQRKALIEQINSKGYEQVMEEVAYTWFNRFIALRFMEVNGYLPSRVRVFTDENNAFNPQILTEAISLEMDGLDMEKVYTFKDANDNDGLFKYLIIVQCNALSPILPKMFQQISDYTELLFPDNLLREGSAIEQMIAMIPEEDWKDAVQIIGWLYQFYNIEPKAEVFAKTGKISKEEIPAATQLFTPDWIVRYMVENSLGRLWIEHNAGSAIDDYDERPGDINELLLQNWKYYIFEADQEPAVQAQLKEIRKEYAKLTPDQIKCIDPCAGSGHILAYMFDVLMQIYEVYGYSAREAVRSIIENNIYGLDIDERASQLAYFSVMMKARQYDRRFLTRKDEDGNPDVPQPHVYEIMESNGLDRNAVEHFVGGDKELKKAMDTLVTEMHDAKEYGSILNITQVDFAALYRRFDEILSDISIFNLTIERELLPFVKIAETLAQKYDAVITNPPYLSITATEANLNNFVKKHYPDSKADLFAVFIEKCRTFTKDQGFFAMITMHSWMFLTSFEKLRNKLMSIDIVNMTHLGARAFEEIGGEVVQTTSFVMRNYNIEKYRGVYCRATEPNTQQGKEELFLSGSDRYVAEKENFTIIPGSPVAYWVSDRVFSVFQNEPLNQYYDIKAGMCTGANAVFILNWHEVNYDQTSMYNSGNYRYTAHNKGGEFRKWYGNRELVLKYNPSALKLMEKNDGFRHDGKDYYFREHIGWSKITSGSSSFRYFEEGFTFDSAGLGLFPSAKQNIFTTLAFLNSKVSEALIALLNPTLNVTPMVVKKLPFTKESKDNIIENITKNNIQLCKTDWDAFETSWDFQYHPLIKRHGGKIYRSWDHDNVVVESPDEIDKWDYLLSTSFESWKQECESRFAQLKANEEELNRIFIDIYGLQDELTPDVDDNDVTVRKADLKRDIKSLISYAVGCMFGRYSLDVPGLAYAGGEWDESKYITFKADKDCIIPICDDEYFADDIVGRFVRFIEVAFGKATLDENLRFIADALGGSGQPKDIIRKYFMDEFYTDHLKMYQKRPIYWLFDSGKKGGFRALVYMHRYQPDTIARMRTDYVHEQQSRYRTAIADLEQRIASASTSERVKLSKRLKKLQEQAAEIQAYEEKIHHLADQYIAIDLDDGVKKNYAIFGDVLAKIK